MKPERTSVLGNGDPHDRAQSDRRRAEAPGGHIEVPIWTECHGGGEVQSSCDFGVLVLAVNAKNLAGTRCGKRIARGLLQHTPRRFHIPAVLMPLPRFIPQRVNKLPDFVALAVDLLCGFLRQLPMDPQFLL